VGTVTVVLDANGYLMQGVDSARVTGHDKGCESLAITMDELEKEHKRFR
jgi:hypothetical protein